MKKPKKREDTASILTSARFPLDAMLHDLKQPMNVIRIMAQGVRLDVAKNRLDVESLPETMRDIEKAVDELVSRIDQTRDILKTKGG